MKKHGVIVKFIMIDTSTTVLLYIIKYKLNFITICRSIRGKEGFQKQI